MEYIGDSDGVFFAVASGEFPPSHAHHGCPAPRTATYPADVGSRCAAWDAEPLSLCAREDAPSWKLGRIEGGELGPFFWQMPTGAGEKKLVQRIATRKSWLVVPCPRHLNFGRNCKIEFLITMERRNIPLVSRLSKRLPRWNHSLK